MKHLSNEEKAHRICETITSIYGVDIAQETHIYSATLEAMQWKDKQHAKEKQQLINEACKWLAENDSYAKPTHLQVDRLREHLNNIK